MRKGSTYRTFTFLLQKEVLQIRRNPFLLRIVAVFPVIIMCVMPWVMNMEVRDIGIVIVDSDRSTLSSRIVQSICASDYFAFRGLRDCYADALKDVEKMDADIILEIPQHYERNIRRGEASQVLVAANAVNGTKGSVGSNYAMQIVASNLQHSIEASALTNGENMFGLSDRQQQKTDTHSLYHSEKRNMSMNLYNKHMSYKLFMIPSLMAILIMLMCGFLPTLNIVSEKEHGTIEAMNVTPISKVAFILAKLVPYWAIALLVMSVCFVLSWAIYGITCQGSLSLMYLLSILLAFIFSGFGLVISNSNNTMQQAIFVMWFFVVTMLLLSGLFTPVRSMPHWAYLTTYVNPMHYYIDAVRTVFIRGGGFASVAHQVLALSIIAAIMNVWAVISYKKQ